MEQESAQSERLSRITSTILHPYIILVPAVAITVINALDEPVDRITWTIYTLIPVFVITLLYAKIWAMMKVSDKSTGISRSLFRDDPLQLLIMTFLFAVPPTLILYLFDGPRDVFWIMFSLGLTMLMITLVNTFYRASYHMAMITSMFTSLGLIFGTVVFITVPLVVILGLSRFKLKAHTPLQIITGFVIGLSASLLSFQLVSTLI